MRVSFFNLQSFASNFSSSHNKQSLLRTLLRIHFYFPLSIFPILTFSIFRLHRCLPGSLPDHALRRRHSAVLHGIGLGSIQPKRRNHMLGIYWNAFQLTLSIRCIKLILSFSSSILSSTTIQGKVSPLFKGKRVFGDVIYDIQIWHSNMTFIYDAPLVFEHTNLSHKLIRERLLTPVADSVISNALLSNKKRRDLFALRSKRPHVRKVATKEFESH